MWSFVSLKISMQTIEPILTEQKLTEVFRTSEGCIYQSDRECCWYVEFGGKLNKFDYRSLLLLKKSVYNINIEDILLKNTRSSDLEIVFICACDHCYVLSVMEIIAMKELLEGTFVMLELNQVIHDRLYRPSF